jgi:hypothetical protein
MPASATTHVGTLCQAWLPVAICFNQSLACLTGSTHPSLCGHLSELSVFAGRTNQKQFYWGSALQHQQVLSSPV